MHRRAALFTAAHRPQQLPDRGGARPGAEHHLLLHKAGTGGPAGCEGGEEVHSGSGRQRGEEGWRYQGEDAGACLPEGLDVPSGERRCQQRLHVHDSLQLHEGEPDGRRVSDVGRAHRRHGDPVLVPPRGHGHAVHPRSAAEAHTGRRGPRCGVVERCNGGEPRTAGPCSARGRHAVPAGQRAVPPHAGCRDVCEGAGRHSAEPAVARRAPRRRHHDGEEQQGVVCRPQTHPERRVVPVRGPGKRRAHTRRVAARDDPGVGGGPAGRRAPQQLLRAARAAGRPRAARRAAVAGIVAGVRRIRDGGARPHGGAAQQGWVAAGSDNPGRRRAAHCVTVVAQTNDDVCSGACLLRIPRGTAGTPRSVSFGVFGEMVTILLHFFLR
eukprot:Rhum_TRINITY_DN8960_c2_g1::Rhum_TRINITY_DN8960_c2_g1_i1::g.30836::m.30836